VLCCPDPPPEHPHPRQPHQQGARTAVCGGICGEFEHPLSGCFPELNVLLGADPIVDHATVGSAPSNTYGATNETIGQCGLPSKPTSRSIRSNGTTGRLGVALVPSDRYPAGSFGGCVSAVSQCKTTNCEQQRRGKRGTASASLNTRRRRRDLRCPA